MTDTIATTGGDLRISFLGHATLLFEWGGTVVHVDPWGAQADYAKLPKADLILVTHGHEDHLADAARAFRPTLLYPYHYGETDPGRLVALLAGSGIEVRVRDLR